MVRIVGDAHWASREESGDEDTKFLLFKRKAGNKLRKNIFSIQRSEHSGPARAWRDICKSTGTLLTCSLIGFVFYSFGLSEANIISIYILGILLIASLTSSWKYGVVSSIAGVLLFNCLYAEPRFNLFVFDWQYSITTIVMLIASMIVNYVMTSFRRQLDKEIQLQILNEQIAREAEAERLRANILRTISHDLRTPLTSMSGSADILLNNEAHIDPAQRKLLLQDIYNDSEWLIKLVENLLFITRIENGVMSIHTEQEALQEIIPEALDHLTKRADEHTITLEMPEELLIVKIEARLIIQVLVNIIDNAIKYSPAGTEIIVRAARRGAQIVVEIADSGCGISDEFKSKAFEMFSTTNKKSGDSRRGVGLGLSLCQAIVHAHGGEISIADNTPRGTIVSFTLNLEEIMLEKDYSGR